MPGQNNTALQSAYVVEKARELERQSPPEVLRWAVRAYRGRIALSSSFGGPTSMAILDMLMEIDRSVPVSYLDTGLLFPETYALVEEVERRYGIAVTPVRAELSLRDQAAAHGDALWARDPDACCGLRKVAPQKAYLARFDAWITGLRRDQGRTRAATPILEWDAAFGLVKCNPLATWDDERVWTYVRERGVPYNALNDRGYRSIGCTHCTRPVAPGEDARAGRWAGTSKTECGLHDVTAGDGI
jgi:phosphoadenosine phosphosulfate reductase